MPKKNLTYGCVRVASVTLLLCGGLLGWPVVRFTYLSGRHMAVREKATFAVPNTNFELQHSRIGINPIVAEYSRKVTYISNGAVGKTTPLLIDGCGGYPINCYLIQTKNHSFLRLVDAVSEHLLDLDSQTTYVITRPKSTPYIGEITDESMSVGWSITENAPSALSVTIGGKRAAPMADMTNDASEVYIGRLAGGRDRLRFIPLSESPEMPIDHFLER